jgi:hypothetical protein
MNADPKCQGGINPDDPKPTLPDPLDRSRTDLYPSYEHGIEELPDTEGERLIESDEEGLDPDRIREKVDNPLGDSPLGSR